MIKFIAVACLLISTKHLVENVRYADNLNHSYENIESYKEAKEDLKNAFEKYSMPLKYLITSSKYDPEVFKAEKRGNRQIEEMLGFKWNVSQDSIVAIPDYNVFGTSRGVPLGASLYDMTEEEIRTVPITRLLWLRLSAQTFDVMGAWLGPLVMALKIFASRACEISTPAEMKLDLKERDQEFCEKAT